jgi:phosphoribosylformylglycinamidine synthase
MASDSFDAEAEQKRPTVQVGDPFTEKVLLEATLEAMRSGSLIAVQDMGAAGLTSSTFEMAARGGTGLRLDLEKVPLREAGLTPYEMMLSESQERMVMVAQRGREEEAARVFRKWGLEVAAIGEITSTGRAELRFRGDVFADIPIAPLTDQAPVYRRPVAEPADLAALQATPDVPPAPNGLMGALHALLSTVDLGSKEWIWRQYDHTVRAATVRGPGSDAAVLRLLGTPSGLALTTTVNSVYCALDPREGGRQAIAEAVRNLACVGAEPIGVTDCLNFGDPEIPAVAWQLREAVAGLAEACRAFDVPVVSGNVSLYNDTRGRSIHPTPTVAMVGLIDELKPPPAAGFAHEGDRVVLLGTDRGEFGGSAYLRLLFEVERGRPPAVDLAAEVALAGLLRRLVREERVSAVHDLSLGGLAVALARLSFHRGLGCDVRWDEAPERWFSESQARALVTVAPQAVDHLLRDAEDRGVSARDLGVVGGDVLTFHAGAERFRAPVSALRAAWSEALPRALAL